MINKRFACELTLSCFCCSRALLLLHMKFLEFAQLTITDVLRRHDVIIDVLNIQNVFWCTENNHFNVLCRKNMF